MALIGPPGELAYRVDRFAPGIYRVFFDRLQRAHGGLRVRPTSFWRSRADNARVGGAANSQHLLATAIDLTYPDSRTRATAIANLRSLGLIAVDEGDHVHVQAWPGEVAVKLVRAVGA